LVGIERKRGRLKGSKNKLKAPNLGHDVVATGLDELGVEAEKAKVKSEHN
jgi:hypothetical protein